MTTDKTTTTASDYAKAMSDKSAQPENVRKPKFIIHTPVFDFDDLSEDAKDVARNWWREGALDNNWYESTFEDALTIGLCIKTFDVDRRRHAGGHFTKDVDEVIRLIIANHGDSCDTFKTAMQYKNEIELARKNNADDQDEADAMVEEITEDFRKSLLEDYAIMLQHEYEYQLSDESADEMIRANEYTFTEQGEREG